MISFSPRFSCFSNRILGFPAIYSSSCDNETDIRVMEFNTDLDYDHYINPVALILCYFVVTITSKALLGPQVNIDPKELLVIVDDSVTRLQPGCAHPQTPLNCIMHLLIIENVARFNQKQNFSHFPHFVIACHN